MSSDEKTPAKGLKADDLADTELTPRVRDAFVTLMDDVNDLRNQLEQARRRLRELETLADYDALMSNVLNRRAFVRELARTISFCERYDFEVSLLYFDLDNFKAINDRFGHSVGDTILRTIGSILVTGVRDTDFVGRLGGDEFAAVLVKAGIEDAQAKAAQFAAAIRDISVDTGNGLSVRAATSFGAYTIQKGVDVEEALAAADRAMYAAKVKQKQKAAGTDPASPDEDTPQTPAK